MLWGHAVKAMIDSLKANARRKRKPFDRDVEPVGQRIRPEYLRKASEEELEHWRQQAVMARKAQQRREWVILAVVLLLSLALLKWAC
jgi:hypothetical protein